MFEKALTERQLNEKLLSYLAAHQLLRFIID